MVRPTNCPNLNHRRSDAPVRFCPRCGEVVNGGVAIKGCHVLGHAKRRKNMEQFCVDCGERLVK
jgi:ribosomal protein S27AE